MKSGYRCVECGKFKEKGSIVYLFQDTDEIYYPLCSKNCAENLNKKEIEKLENKILKIKNRKIDKEIW